MRPFAESDGHDLPRLVDELVPRGAAMGDDVVVVFEDAVREPVVAQELPDVFHGVQFRRTRRQEHQGDVVRHFELRRDVPSGLIEDEHGMRSLIDGLADLGEMLLHGFGITIGQDKARTLSLPRADGPEDVGPHGALIQGCGGSGSATRPPPRDLVLLAYARFVGPPELEVGAAREPASDFRQSGGEVFLKASASSSFWA
ncbi:transposase [Sinorhizobium fredii USDA 257]|uniref:Transposase n=1 Tax=Sinorhizobium fredii (strain USDA 257) TaxID=1185652 RepID=I3XEZ1_SINF2|nr:transposase [Sinorhizobium fredii USDA 257]